MPFPSKTSLGQMVHAEQMMQSHHEALIKAGFSPVEGSPDEWEFCGSAEQMKAELAKIYGTQGALINPYNAMRHQPAKPQVKPYRASTTLMQIVTDGWARGFHADQTLRELRAMGFVSSIEWVQAYWSNFDEAYKRSRHYGSDNIAPGGEF